MGLDPTVVSPGAIWPHKKTLGELAITARSKGQPMPGNLKTYLEGKKAAAGRVKEPDNLQFQLLNFARNADAQLKAILSVANGLIDELSGSGVLGVGLSESDGLISGITLQLTVGEKTVKSSIKVVSKIIYVTMSSPLAPPVITADNTIHVGFVNSVELDELDAELIRSLVKQMIDQIFP
jgi:hypothetical protein